MIVKHTVRTVTFDLNIGAGRSWWIDIKDKIKQSYFVIFPLLIHVKLVNYNIGWLVLNLKRKRPLNLQILGSNRISTVTTAQAAATLMWIIFFFFSFLLRSALLMITQDIHTLFIVGLRFLRTPQTISAPRVLWLVSCYKPPNRMSQQIEQLTHKRERIKTRRVTASQLGVKVVPLSRIVRQLVRQDFCCFYKTFKKMGFLGFYEY